MVHSAEELFAIDEMAPKGMSIKKITEAVPLRDTGGRPHRAARRHSAKTRHIHASDTHGKSTDTHPTPMAPSTDTHPTPMAPSKKHGQHHRHRQHTRLPKMGSRNHQQCPGAHFHLRKTQKSFLGPIFWNVPQMVKKTQCVNGPI